MRMEIYLESMEIGYSIDLLPSGKEVKVMHLILKDINEDTYHLPMPEEVFHFVEFNLGRHLKKFKRWLHTGKLKPLKDEQIKIPVGNVDYFQ